MPFILPKNPHQPALSNLISLGVLAVPPSSNLQQPQLRVPSRSPRLCGEIFSFSPSIQNLKTCPGKAAGDDGSKIISPHLKKFGLRAPLAQVACALDAEPVLNDETRQMMAFDPSSGELLKTDIFLSLILTP